MDGWGGWIAVALAAGVFWGVRYLYRAGRIQGMREATESLSRMCSSHYEVHGEPLPEKVEAALESIKRALKQTAKDKPTFYLNAAGALGDAMGYAAWSKGYDAGVDATEPRDGETRIDMSLDRWQILRRTADIGFHYRFPDFKPMLVEWEHFDSQEAAEEAERAIARLEYGINHRKSDPEYSDSLSRNMLIWNRWPQEKQA